VSLPGFEPWLLVLLAALHLPPLPLLDARLLLCHRLGLAEVAPRKHQTLAHHRFLGSMYEDDTRGPSMSRLIVDADTSEFEIDLGLFRALVKGGP